MTLKSDRILTKILATENRNFLKSGNFNIVNSQALKIDLKAWTHWKYHKTNAIMFISLKNMVQNSLGVDFFVVLSGFWGF